MTQDGECNSENNKNDGTIYHCNSLDCPIHGQRNQEFHRLRFFPTLEEKENYARNQRPSSKD